MAVPVVSRDSFVTDPFFDTTRQILERCLYEISLKHQELQNPTNIDRIPGFLVSCCCCCHQPTERFADWAPAVLIPCLNCCPTNNQHAQDWQFSPHSVQHPGHLTLTHSHFELVVDVHGFQPHEINVSVKHDIIEVCAQQEPTAQCEAPQTILRRYKLPHLVNSDQVQCSLSKEGILVMTAPWT